MVSNIRYALPAMMLGVIVAAAVLPNALLVILSGLALCFNAANILFGPGYRPDMHIGGRTWLLFIAVTAVSSLAWLGLHGAPEDAIGRLRGWTRTAGGRAGVAAVSAAGLCLALVLAMYIAQPRQPSPDTLTIALAKVAVANPVIAVVDVSDVALLLGPRVDRHIVAVGSGETGLERQITDAGQFDEKLRQLRASIVVVDNGPHTVASAKPEGWSAPASWLDLGREGNAEVFITDLR